MAPAGGGIRPATARPDSCAPRTRRAFGAVEISCMVGGRNTMTPDREVRDQPHGAAARFPIGIVFTISPGQPLPRCRSAARSRWRGVGSVPATLRHSPRPSSRDTEPLARLQRCGLTALASPVSRGMLLTPQVERCSASPAKTGPCSGWKRSDPDLPCNRVAPFLRRKLFPIFLSRSVKSGCTLRRYRLSFRHRNARRVSQPRKEIDP